jgi:hypothetical protein
MNITLIKVNLFQFVEEFEQKILIDICDCSLFFEVIDYSPQYLKTDPSGLLVLFLHLLIGN